VNLSTVLFTDEARVAGKRSLHMVERGGKQKVAQRPFIA